MSRIQCALCHHWFGSELRLKVHYSKKHAPVISSWKRKAKTDNNNELLNNDMLYELCEAFGDYGEDPVKESNNEEVARDEQSAFLERRSKRFSKKSKNIHETPGLEETVEEDETDVLFEDVDVSLEDNSLEDVVPDVPDNDVNLEDVILEDADVPDDDVNLEDLVPDVPDDVADEDADTDDHQEIEVNEAVYDDMEEMNESSLLKLLEEYDCEKT